METSIVEQDITVGQLRALMSEWEYYHIIQLKHEFVEERIQARKKRDEIEKSIQEVGFMPCYVDDALMLIVY